MIAYDPLLEYFDKVAEVLDFEFELEKAKNESELEQFKKYYNLDKLVKEIDSGKVPEQLEFYFGGNNENFFTKLISLFPNSKNVDFLDFLASDFCAEIMRQNKLSIHIETDNLYYDNMNTCESIYEYILSQQAQTKKIVNSNLYYRSSFESYLREFLAGIDADTDARFYTLPNQNMKYLFYRHNDFLLSRGLSPGEVRHTKLSADEVVLEELQSRNWQHLIESLIYKVEKRKIITR